MLIITITKLHTGLFQILHRLTDVGIYSFVHAITELALNMWPSLPVGLPRL